LDFVTITDWLELTAIENVKLETIEILGKLIAQIKSFKFGEVLLMKCQFSG